MSSFQAYKPKGFDACCCDEAFGLFLPVVLPLGGLGGHGHPSFPTSRFSNFSKTLEKPLRGWGLGVGLIRLISIFALAISHQSE